MPFALLQESTANLADDGKKFAKGVAEEPLTIFTALREFLQGVYNYIFDAEFVGHVLASALVAFIGILV
ncbi:MAG TPA: hypothetical protein VFY54_14605, partial [Rubrobacter sp.]|nr:hypothetical protein [Rubrobacter sp.]